MWDNRTNNWSWEKAGEAAGPRQRILTRPAHANVVQVLRPHKVKMFWPSDIKLLKDWPVKLGQLDVPEQPK